MSKGVTEIFETCQEECLPEEVYRRLRNAQCTLFVFHGDKPLGFAVFEVCNDVMDKPYLNGWLMHFVGIGIARSELLAFTDELARKAHCTKVRFSSPRLGWERFLGPDFEKKLIVYERKVP